MSQRPNKRRSAPVTRMDSVRPRRHAVRVTGRDPKRLAKAVHDARGELDLTQEEFAAKARLSTITVQRVEAGSVTPRTKTFTGLDRGARWPPGTAREIYERGAERPASVHVHSPPGGEQESSITPSQLSPERLAEVEQELAWMAPDEVGRIGALIGRAMGDEAAEQWLQKVIEIRRDARIARALDEAAGHTQGITG